jgi:hypothetical protein
MPDKSNNKKRGKKKKKIYIGFGHSRWRWSKERMAHLPVGEMELQGEEQIG